MSRVVSLNIGKVSVMVHRGRQIKTAIGKRSIKGRIRLQQTGFEGDQVADRKNHGGLDKAVYSYAIESYDDWQKRGVENAAAALVGENLTTEGLYEDDVCIGDHIAINDAVLCATQPRIPCYKLSARVGRRDFAKMFINDGRPGIYMKVLTTGHIGAGDDIRIVKRDPQKISIRKIMELYFTDTENYEMIQALVNHKDLPMDMLKVLRKRLLQSHRLC